MDKVTIDKTNTTFEPTLTQTFSLYGIAAFDVQYWNGAVPGGSVTGNNKVWRQFTFAPITTTKIRVVVNAGADAYSRVIEVEAWTGESGGTPSGIQWLVTDHLGTPRMIIDRTGSLANVKRHDYLPFGEELFAPAGGRSTSLGYAAGDGVRQQFTQKERDVETGLDYFLARYYSGIQGRFTSSDDFKDRPPVHSILGSGDSVKQALVYADATNPQSLNKYQYTLNNPIRYVDPDGQAPQDSFDAWITKQIERQLKGEITEEQYKENLKGPAVGTAVAVAIIVMVRGGPPMAAALYRWATRNPEKVQQIAQAMQEASGGPPGLTLAVKSRLSPEEISTGQRLAKQLGLKLMESPHVGSEYVVVGTNQTIDALGTVDAYRYFGDGKKFFESIKHHVNKSNAYTSIDLNGASPKQIQAIENYVNGLTDAEKARIIYVKP